MRLLVVTACFVAVIVSAHAGRQERQLFSSSRFSSSGLVFPGPPGQQRPGRPQQQRPAEDQLAVEKSDSGRPPFDGPNRPAPLQQRQGSNFRPGNGPRPPFAPGNGGPQSQPKPNPERSLPPVPLSLIGQQPEEFIAAAQQRQQQQQQQQQVRPQSPPSARTPQEEDEEPVLTSAEVQEEFVPRQQPPRPQQPKEVPEKPIRIRRPQEDSQRPEPSIQQPVQQRRPNYPGDYKPTRPQQNNGLDDERRQPAKNQQEELEDELLDEEEEVKPDKLQLLLQKTDFSCAEKKDGYYADEAVECEIFHYCQDRTRHSWLCPEGAIFHQVHLICMPVAKDNICKKSSQFHFVNEYLYQPMVDEDGNNSTLYADRYYPEGYEPGVPFDMAEAQQPEKPNLQYNGRRTAPAQQSNRRPIQQQRYNPDRPNRERQQPNENRRVAEQRRAPFQAPSEDEEVVPFNKPGGPGRNGEEILRESPNRRAGNRPQIQLEVSEEEEEQQ